MNTTEMVISLIIGAVIVIVWKVVKFNKECRRRLEEAEKSREVSNLILEVLDCLPKVDYALFIRKQTMIYRRMMEFSTSIWKCLTYVDRKKVIQDLSDEYDRKHRINNKDQENLIHQ